MLNSGRNFHRVLVFAVTVRDLDLDQVEGEMERLAKELRDVNVSLRYFWWGEFQRRGAIHYHGLAIDPHIPKVRDQDRDEVAIARHYFDAHWPHMDIQAHVEYRSAGWFRDHAPDYVMKDVRKLGGKRYEQDYHLMPRKWKTFSSHRLATSLEDFLAHESEVFTVFDRSTKQVIITDIHHHVPGPRGCVITPGRCLNRRRVFERLFPAARAGPSS